MEPEVVHVTGETTKKYRDVNTQELEDGQVRVTEAAMEPTVAELLEQERVDKAMRGEEIIDGLDEVRGSAQEEIEEWTVGARRSIIMRSTSRLQERLAAKEANSDPEVRD